MSGCARGSQCLPLRWRPLPAFRTGATPPLAGAGLDLLKGVELGLGPGGNFLELLGLLFLDLLKVRPGGLLLGLGAALQYLAEALLSFLDLRRHLFRRGGKVLEGCVLENPLSLLYGYRSQVGNQGFHLLDGSRVDL